MDKPKMQSLKMQSLLSEEIDLQGAAGILDVSNATVRNWIRHGYVVPLEKRRKVTFDASDIHKLKTRLSNGQLDRLNKRANKKSSTAVFIPAEYAANLEVSPCLDLILNTYREENLSLHASMLALVLNYLRRCKLIGDTDFQSGANLETPNQVIQREIGWWLKRCDDLSSPGYQKLISCELPQVSDFLGLTYQSLLLVGAKNKIGSYYTPKAIVNAVVNDYLTESSSVLDPCCGTGRFLLSAAEKISNPENIWGFETDEIAAHLARIQIIAAYPHPEFSPHIYVKNALFDVDMGLPKFNVVMTNPPWGAQLSPVELGQVQSLFPAIKSNETYSMFIEKGLQFLQDGGILSYILPESILNIKTHADIRKVILESTSIVAITDLGRAFGSVFTPAIRIDLRKERADAHHKLAYIKKQKTEFIEQIRFRENPDFIFDLVANEEDLAIMERVYARPHLTLEGHAEWALGIVTGDNARYLRDVPCEGEPILTGKDLRRFIAKPAQRFIDFKPGDFQQVAPVSLYRAPEKLLYRFVSNELVFSYDDQKTLSLNSANVLIPCLPHYPVKAVLGFLNSSLYQFLFQKKFGALKVLRGDLEKLPFPILDEDEISEVSEQVELILDRENGDSEKRFAFDRLDDLIMNFFDLSESQREHVRDSAKISSQSLSFES